MAPQSSQLHPTPNFARRSQEGPHYVSANCLLVDDFDPAMFSFPEGRWKVQPDTQWYSGMVSTYDGPSSSVTPGPANGDQESLEESMTLRVDARTVSLTGMAPSNPSSPFYISFDGAPPIPQTFARPLSSDPSASSASTYRTWFTTPLENHVGEGLITSLHNLTFYNLPAGVSIDYARVIFGIDFDNGLPPTFEPGPGRRALVVDDSDPNIEWSEGGWEVSQREWGIAPSGYRSRDAGGTTFLEAEALGDTVHSSSTVGSSGTVYFWGTGMSVYGYLPRDIPSGGAVSVSYRVDKGPNVVRKYTYGSSDLDTPAGGNATAVGGDAALQQHFELYGVKGLVDGTHMLQFNITEISTPSPLAALHIDYFTFVTTQSPAVLVLGANANPVPELFLREMDILKTKPKKGLTTPYIVAVVVLSISSLVLLYFGRKFLVIGLAWILRLGDAGSAEGGKSRSTTASEETRGEKRRGKRDVVRRFATKVRLDLELSWHQVGVLRSTILDIRPRTPPPPSPSSHQPQTPSLHPSPLPGVEIPAPVHLPTQRPRRPLPALPNTPPAYTEEPVHPAPALAEGGGTRRDLNGIREYLTRVNARLAAAIVGAGSAGRDWVLGSMSSWGSRGQETLPAYRTMDSS